jgi:putative transposase
MACFDAAGGSATTWFFTLTLRDRGARHLVDHVAQLRAAVAEVRARHPFRIEAMVVLPEHLHALWTLPAGEGECGKRRALVQRSFTQRLQLAGVLDESPPGRRGRSPGLWQRRAWERPIADAGDFARHVDYIHFNPVRHGWVLRAADWPYSSLHRHVRAGRLPPDWSIAGPIAGQFGE